MKQKVKFTDTTGKTIINEITIRNIEHFIIQQNTRSHVFVDRRKKKPKYKKNYILDQE